MTTTGAPTHQRLDLRKVEVDDVLDRVQATLALRLDTEGSVRKRRSIGFRSDRETWVRVECRGLDRPLDQGWGTEAASGIAGVPMPAWHQGGSWLDTERGVRWRADETDLIGGNPIGTLQGAHELPRLGGPHLARPWTRSRPTKRTAGRRLIWNRQLATASRQPSRRSSQTWTRPSRNGRPPTPTSTGRTLQGHSSRCSTGRTSGPHRAVWTRPHCGSGPCGCQRSQTRSPKTYRPTSDPKTGKLCSCGAAPSSWHGSHTRSRNTQQ